MELKTILVFLRHIFFIGSLWSRLLATLIPQTFNFAFLRFLYSKKNFNLNCSYVELMAKYFRNNYKIKSVIICSIGRRKCFVKFCFKIFFHCPSRVFSQKLLHMYDNKVIVDMIQIVMLMQNRQYIFAKLPKLNLCFICSNIFQITKNKFGTFLSSWQLSIHN